MAIIIGSAIKGPDAQSDPPHDALFPHHERAYSATSPARKACGCPGLTGAASTQKITADNACIPGPQKTLRLSLRLISSYPLPIYLLVGRININNTTTQ
ncbi:hypothetical protein ACTJNA_00185 [Klebsiella pneumoniae]